MRILITGGSGYLGQFLIAASLRDGQHELAYTHLESTALPLDSSSGVLAFRANLATGEGLAAALLAFRPQVVINCAALSQPAACEQEYDACQALNVPSKLLKELEQLREQHGITALLVHLSTDQVYNGTRAWWTEADAPDPINAYGRSKLEAERLLQQQWWGRFLALRSSLIFGPEPPLAPVGRPLFLQFVRQVLESGKETTFFVDEFRCAVYVEDICAVVSHIIKRFELVQQQQSRGAGVEAGGNPDACALANLPHSVYNMGGPDRLSRHDMAMAVAQHCGLDSKAVLTANSADVKRGYNSPLDISMSAKQLLADMQGVALTPFTTALQRIFPAAGSS